MTLKDILTITKETFENKTKEQEEREDAFKELLELRVAHATTKTFTNLIQKNINILDEKHLMKLIFEALYILSDQQKIMYFESIFELFEIE